MYMLGYKKVILVDPATLFLAKRGTRDVHLPKWNLFSNPFFSYLAQEFYEKKENQVASITKTRHGINLKQGLQSWYWVPYQYLIGLVQFNTVWYSMIQYAFCTEIIL